MTKRSQKNSISRSVYGLYPENCGRSRFALALHAVAVPTYLKIFCLWHDAVNVAMSRLRNVEKQKVKSSCSHAKLVATAILASMISAYSAVVKADDPVINTPTDFIVSSDADTVFSVANGNAISIIDPGNSSDEFLVSISVPATKGTLALADTSSLTFANGNNTSMIEIRGSIASIEAALDGLTLSIVAGCECDLSLELDITVLRLISTGFVNSGFEEPLVPGDDFTTYLEADVPGWSTSAADNEIEFWPSGFRGVPAHTGDQFVEINANSVAILSQVFTPLDAGVPLRFAFAHRGRSGTDSVRVVANDLGLDGDVGGGDDTVLFDQIFSSPEGSWSEYFVDLGDSTGNSVRVEFDTSSFGGGSSGNFIDSVEFINTFNKKDQTVSLNFDSDTDGIVNQIDTDDDNDGIPDSVENANSSILLDSDNDGTANHCDIDSDGDGIGDSIEAGANPLAPVDTDGDGTPDYLDLDADGDGISDAIEAGVPAALPVDTDGDNTPDYLDLDSDGDRVDDSVELAVDTDGDGIADFRDGDSDGDGVTDAIEGTGDTDGDGIPDRLEQRVDSDGFGLPDFLDVDSDNDGVPDAVEGAADSDGDGIPDYLDSDSDNDTLTDTFEAGGDDADGDGVIDGFVDVDGDGMDDNTSLTPLLIPDTDSDGTVDMLDVDSDGDGIPDEVEAGSEPTEPVDTDSDGIPDFQELDSDNDGITDSIEAGGNPSEPADTDGNGIPDFQESLAPPPVVDSDGDGDGDGIPDTIEGTDDTDIDGVPDYLDIDSDNDGLPDSVEAGGTSVPADTDGDGIFDFLDRDSDNDGLTDTLEAGGSDIDGDGIVDNFIDNNGDGHDDGVGVAPLSDADFDGDGFVDRLDVDSDNDGLSDVFESLGSGVDNDGDGQVDNIVDANNDGLADGVSVNASLDTDDDGASNHLDLDSDGDNLTDLAESGGADVNNDGRVDAWSDSDGDGVPDNVDFDLIGGDDIDGDGIVDKADVDFSDLPDSDGDGIVDSFDTNPDGDGFIPFSETPITNAVLPDLNDNGVPDLLESAQAQGASSTGRIQTGLDGVGCSVASPGDKRDPFLMILMMVSSLWILVSRKLRRQFV